MRTKPLQNRVDPWGTFHAVSARGSLMGNRGILHNNEQQIIKQWTNKAWVTCVLCYGDIQRNVFSPNSYSELFFLDEATAFAAGHRPCAACQHARSTLFKQYWAKAHPAKSGKLGMPEIDKQLHAERVLHSIKQSYIARVNELPVGTLFEYEANAILMSTRGCLLWGWEGYSKEAIAISPDQQVNVLTPPTIVKIFALGFDVSVHPSAG